MNDFNDNGMNYINKFHWSEETLTHFKLRMFAELGLTKEVTEFVEESL